jgi:hypothetical protein
MVFNKSGIMTELSSKRRERHVAHILTKKSRTKSVYETESREEIRLNPIIKYLIINGYVDG